MNVQNPQPIADTGQRIVDLVEQEGSAAAPFVLDAIGNFGLLSPADIADVAHYLCVLHGRYPGIIDNAAVRIVDPAARTWLVQAMDAFAGERSYLTRLTVAAGPVVGIGGDDSSAGAIALQGKAYEMLATSDRNGCSAGAAIAFASDWLAIRRVLDRIAMRLGIESADNQFPSLQTNIALANHLAVTPSIARAMLFGADQLIAQKRGLWQLLSARQRTRNAQI